MFSTSMRSGGTVRVSVPMENPSGAPCTGTVLESPASVSG